MGEVQNARVNQNGATVPPTRTVAPQKHGLTTSLSRFLNVCRPPKMDSNSLRWFPGRFNRSWEASLVHLLTAGHERASVHVTNATLSANFECRANDGLECHAPSLRFRAAAVGVFPASIAFDMLSPLRSSRWRRTTTPVVRKCKAILATIGLRQD